MAKHSYTTTLAALVLDGMPRMAIDLLADEILESNIAKRASARAISWDCDDLVFLDLDNLRIALHEVEPSPSQPPLLCLGVGTVPGRQALNGVDCTNIAQELAQRLSQIVSCNALLWHKAPHALDADIMDDFQDEITWMLDHLEADMQALTANSAASVNTDNPLIPMEETINDRLHDTTAFHALSDDLNARGATTSAFSTSAHVTLYLTVCTFMLTLPALGSALLSYLWLRNGVDKPSSPT